MRALWMRIIAWEGGSSFVCVSAAQEIAASTRAGRTVGGGCVSSGYFVRIVGELVTAVRSVRRCPDPVLSMRRRHSIVAREYSGQPLIRPTGPNCSRRWGIRRNSDPADMIFGHHRTRALIIKSLENFLAVDPETTSFQNRKSPSDVNQKLCLNQNSSIDNATRHRHASKKGQQLIKTHSGIKKGS